MSKKNHCELHKDGTFNQEAPGTHITAEMAGAAAVTVRLRGRQRKEKEIRLAARQNSCDVGTYKGRPLGLPERSLYGKEYAESRSWR